MLFSFLVRKSFMENIPILSSSLERPGVMMWLGVENNGEDFLFGIGLERITCSVTFICESYCPSFGVVFPIYMNYSILRKAYLTFLVIIFRPYAIIQYIVFTLQFLTQFFLRRQIKFIF